MSDSHGLRGVSNKISRYERVLHADMSHRDAVADSDRREEHRSAARGAHPSFDSLSYLVEMHVPRHYFIV